MAASHLSAPSFVSQPKTDSANKVNNPIDEWRDLQQVFLTACVAATLKRIVHAFLHALLHPDLTNAYVHKRWIGPREYNVSYLRGHKIARKSHQVT